MKKALVKTVSIYDQRAQHRMECRNHGFNTPAEPRQARASPPCADISHVDVFMARPLHKLLKQLPVSPRSDSIEQGERHGRTLISESTMFVLNLVQLIGASLGILFFQRQMVSLEENAAHIFKPVAQVGVTAGESAAAELNFPPIDPQYGMEQLKHSLYTASG